MKILTICDGATVRSVCLARLLKDGQVDGRTHDALAASGFWNSKKTFRMLCEWADLVVVMETHMKDQYVPRDYHDKTKVCDVGPDIYQNPLHPDLMTRCRHWIKQEGL